MNRRGFLLSLCGGIIAAPAIVRASSLMAIKPFDDLVPEPMTAHEVILRQNEFLEQYREEFVRQFEQNYLLLRPDVVVERRIRAKDIRFTLKAPNAQDRCHRPSPSRKLSPSRKSPSPPSNRTNSPRRSSASV